MTDEATAAFVEGTLAGWVREYHTSDGSSYWCVRRPDSSALAVCNTVGELEAALLGGYQGYMDHMLRDFRESRK